ncbi:hypothetical protein ABZ851_30140 [Streptomyces sp. NPDC047049]|uniref:hypothetical protein n=1 Tax=Streptomyces sp. NPDC047049 TaxID=3156688 RepID=UPI0033EEA551
MLLNPAIRCACGATDLVAAPLYRSDGSTGVAVLTCTFCGLTWEAGMTPTCPGPNYTQAYATAEGLDLVDEELELLFLAEDIKERSTAAFTGRGPAVDTRELRDFLLRKAAFLDQTAYGLELGWFLGQAGDESVNDASSKAVLAAREFLEFDCRHDAAYALGPTRVTSPDWACHGGTRAYVRQEYLALRRAEEAEADQEEYLPHRDSSGELLDTEGRPL